MNAQSRQDRDHSSTCVTLRHCCRIVFGAAAVYTYFLSKMLYVFVGGGTQAAQQQRTDKEAKTTSHMDMDMDIYICVCVVCACMCGDEHRHRQYRIQ